MSFVYAEKTQKDFGQEISFPIKIYSDTKTELIGAYKSNWSEQAYKLIKRFGFTKCINICSNMALSFAGNNTAYAHDLLNWMESKGKFDEEDAIEKAFEIHKSANKDDIEFIICYVDDNNENHIVCIKERQILRDVSSAWIGSPKAFRELQKIRSEEGYPINISFSLFQRAVEKCKDDSVGGFLICDCYDANERQFIFQERLEAYGAGPQIIPPGGIIAFNRPAETGDCTIHFIPDPFEVIIEFYQNSTILLYTRRYRYSEIDTNNKHTNHFLLPMLVDARTNKVLPV